MRPFISIVFKSPKLGFSGIGTLKMNKENWKKQLNKKEENQKSVVLGKQRRRECKEDKEVNKDLSDMGGQ